MNSEEEKQLRKIAETASDFLMAERYEEFAEASGGIEKLKQDLVQAIADYEGETGDGECSTVEYF